MLGLRARWLSWSLLRKISIILLITLGAGVLYLWHLGTLTPGISPAELAAQHSSAHLHSIINNPINAPQRKLQFGLQAVGHHGAFWLRLPSVVLAIFYLGLFYLLAKAWFGRIVGILSTAMLATTPWIILLARSETANIMLLGPIVLLASYSWLMRVGDKNREFKWLVLVIASAVSIYTPGIIWLILAGAILNRTKLIGTIKSLRQPAIWGSLVLGIILLMPLVWSTINDPAVGKTLILWPQNWPGAITVIKSICWSALALVWRFPYHTDIIIGRWPILDVTQIILVLFGVFALWNKARKRLYILKGSILLGIVAAGIDHNLMYLTLALPAIAILTAGGLRYLYVEWRSVFPLNPIPKTLAIVVMALLVSLHMLFGIRYALIAWPHTVATRQTYVLK